MNNHMPPYTPFLSDHGYVVDGARVWRPQSSEHFEYSDGDEVETRIAAAIASATDLSLLSPQLAEHQIDWPSIYHLSPVRANLLRPLAPMLAGKRILEIGSGCGAISRYLGELGANLLALEGSARRASATASRCRDLGNVTVVNQNLEQFPDGERYDVVTLIGVLEYARKYSSEADGVAATLRRARSLLKDDGVLVVAIENQFGLKYFAGMHEDHLGRAMAGIQDQYEADGVVTFGRRELDEKIHAAGFSDCDFALPFPDYKLPSNLVLPAGWKDGHGFNSASLAGQATRSDRQLTHPLLFSTAQAFAVAQRNGLMADLSNSFLVLARATRAAPTFEDIAPGVLACHYAVERQPHYATGTTIRRDGDKVSVVRARLAENAPVPRSALIAQHLIEEPYALGQLWSDELDRILSRPGWRVDDVSEWLTSWLDALEAHAPAARRSNDESLRHEIPGHLVDAIPRNLVRTPEGNWVFFDQEWALKPAIKLGYLAFRAFNVSLATVTSVAHPADAALLHVPSLFRACMRQLGYVVTGSEILDYLDFDAAIHSEVRGRLSRPQTLAEYDAYTLVPSPAITPLLHGTSQELPALAVRLSEQEAHLAAARSALADAEAALAAKMQHVAALEIEVGHVQSHGETQRTQLDGIRAHVASLEHLVAEQQLELDRVRSELVERTDAARIGEETGAGLRQDLDAALHSIAEKDNEINRLWSLNRSLEESGAVAELRAQELERSVLAAHQLLRTQESMQAELAALRASTSWRLTTPLRVLKSQWLRLTQWAASRAGATARTTYRKLPMSPRRRVALKGMIFRRFPIFFSRTNAYRRWQADVATHGPDVGYQAIARADQRNTQHYHVEGPALHDADGVTEWLDYPEVKARIAAEIHAKRQAATPKPTRILDFSSSDLRKVASRIKLPASADTPDVSIIIPAFNHAARTLECLASIADTHDGSQPTFEVIVADDASTEPSARFVADVQNVNFVRQDTNLGFLRNCNTAASHARGKALLFLNNDVQVTHGWLGALWTCLQSSADIGAAGPKIVYPSGWLQDAGTRLRRDGTGEMIGLNDVPDNPAYAYDRDVDYCSGACLLVRRDEFDAVGGFDDRLAPAYCEDSDLCMQLKARGKRVVYCAGAEVVHHLSATSDSLPSDYKLSCIARNLEVFEEKWRPQLDQMDTVRTIAFYLPQFHPFPENDLWWGEGFTEWTNVTKARPNYVGHYQPRVPADLGYYDLRVSEVMSKQAELARRYGVGGFCFYYYWFAGHRLLERPIEQMLASGEPDFPFCLCWANENWTRRWDGQEHDVLMAQQHSDDDDLAVIADLARYFRSDSYIRVNGKPLLLVYRVTLFPDFARTAALWRTYCRDNGIGEIYLTQVESFELVTAGIRPEDLGCDAAVEFPPQGMAEPRQPSGELLNQNFVGAVADYHDLAVRYATRESPAYKRFMGVMPGWDNTARRQNNSYSFERASPGAFQAWLEVAVKRTKQQHSGDERLIFINAWNEWAEGAYLEPDKRFGHSFLQAHLNALETEYLVERNSAFPG